MSRLVAFALGGVFGALALYLLAPRWFAPVVQEAPVAAPVIVAEAPVASPPPPSGTPIVEAPVVATPPPASPPVALPPASSAEATVASAPPATPPVAAPPPTMEPGATSPESTAEATVAPEPPATPDAKSADEIPDAVVGVPPDIPAQLMIPVEGAKPESLIDTFTEARGGGSRPHDAIDIMAPAGTPVRAVDDGRIVKLFLSQGGGGITVYQFDPTERFAYYYAHLERYADGLAEGQAVKRGDVIGYVGSTGNANPAAPHLHFAVVVLGPEKRWWEGTAINPYPILIGATKDAAAVAASQ